MDPLTVTLAVVSLATAVKDMLELAQKIHESFAKVSNNLRKAQHVAKDIAEMVEKINVFYANHQDTLDNTENFRLALLSLLDKFRSFETLIVPLLPKKGGRRLGRFLRRWWNNNKIEGGILDLERNVVQVMLEYMVDSAMRAEVKLETVHQETSRGLTGITQGLEVLEVVRRDVSALRIMATPTAAHYSLESSGRRSDEFNRNVIMFAQSRTSTSAPMLRKPDVITEELVTIAYIKLQINNIATVVEKIRILPVSGAPTTAFQLSKVFDQPSMSIMHLRRDVVRQVTIIRDLLDTEHIQTVSIYDGARTLNELAVGLAKLGMRGESVLVGKWAITLARTLVGVSSNSQPNPIAHLALYLVNQSMQYRFTFNRSNMIHSLELIKESYAMTQNLRSQHAGQVHFQILYSNVLLEYAELVDNKRSIEMSIEAIQVLEDIFNVQAFTQSNSRKTFVIVQPSSCFLHHLFSSAPTTFSIMVYALALSKLGTYVFRDGLLPSALDLVLLGITILRKMVSVNGHVHRAQLAGALFMLVRGEIGVHVPAEELINVIDECIQVYRALAEQNPVAYTRRLISALSRKAGTLVCLKRDGEAIATWQEAANLAEQTVQDSRLCATMLSNLSNHFRHLKRHDDAARKEALAIAALPNETDAQAWRYSCLSEDLLQLRRYKEAADAARSSVRLYRDLAMREPQLIYCMCYLAEGLSKLAHYLAASGDYSEVIIAWKESVKMVVNSLNQNRDAEFSGSNEFLPSLRIHLSISYVLQDEEECLKVCSTAVQCLLQLLEVDLQKEDVILSVLSAEFGYAYTMSRFGRLQAAQEYIDHWLDEWSSKQWAISGSKLTEWHMSMIILYADVLDAQGFTEQALLASQKSQDIVRPSTTSHQPLFDKMIESMVQQARLQVNFGSVEGALRVAEEALRLCRDNKLGPVIGTLVLSLHGAASASLSCGDYERAVEAAREACNILTSPESLEIWETDEQNVSKRASLYAILSSAEANLGNRSTAIEYAYRAVDVSLDIRDMKADISATTAERSYMETRGNLADILLATGHLAQAWEICKERRDYFSKRVDKWMSDYRELAPILRMLGILCCSEGHHEEGQAAAEELSGIMRKLGSAFPSLQEQVKVRLRNQANVPILKVLDDMSQKLNCGHQEGVVSLFEL